jgi:glycosyltransferase involved in cell wall biosynthesis
VEPGVTGWTVRSKDVDQLAAVIANWLTIPDAELSRMRSYSKDRAAAFSIRSMVNSYESLYERMFMC